MGAQQTRVKDSIWPIAGRQGVARCQKKAFFVVVVRGVGDEEQTSHIFLRTAKTSPTAGGALLTAESKGGAKKNLEKSNNAFYRGRY